MGQTGYDNQDFLVNPAYMLDARISPQAIPDINQIARQNNVTPEQVVDGLVNAAFAYFEDSIEDALQRNAAKMGISYFQNCPVAITLSVQNSEISAIVVNRYEAGLLEGAMETGREQVDLGWLAITLNNAMLIDSAIGGDY